jgi:putative PIN family toxin of toxin-antitoxin system
VIDTNVIVSSFLQPGSIPNQVVKHALEGSITPLVSEGILFEYNDVLTRNKFKIEREKLEEFYALLTSRAIFLDRTITDEEFVDSTDIVFYEVALTGKKEKETYLVTGNKKHFPVKSFVVTPREMIEIIECDQNSK